MTVNTLQSGEQQRSMLLPIPRPFLLAFVSPAGKVMRDNDDPTIWETEAQTSDDGIVRTDYADDEDEGRGTSVLEDSDGKEDEDA